jgi:hypothetical protein
MSLLPEFDCRLGSSFRWGRGCWGIAEQSENRAKRMVREEQAHCSRSSFLTLREEAQINCSGSQIVAMMKTAKPGH